MHWLGMALAFASILLFRKGACYHRLSRQVPWVLGGLASGFLGTYLPHGLTITNIVLLAIALLLYAGTMEAYGRAPRFAQMPIYYGGLLYLIVLNSFAIRCDYVGAAVCVGLFTSVYLIVKLVTRGYEYNSTQPALNTVPRKDTDAWPPGSGEDSTSR